MTFRAGQSGNPLGRPRVKDLDKPTNRSLREKALLELIRKFRPLQTKAIQAAVNILDNKESGDQNKLKSAALIISTYKDLLKDVYDYRYDGDEAEAMQEENKPTFSLHMISSNKESFLEE
jgi:hypothetical protein